MPLDTIVLLVFLADVDHHLRAPCPLLHVVHQAKE